MTLFFSVSSENIPGIDFLFYIVQTAVVAVGNDGVGLLFEVLQIVYDYRSEEGTAIFQCGLVDDDAGTFGLNAFHDALNGTLAEVVAVRLHRQPVYSDDALLFVRRIECTTIVIVVISYPKEGLL